MANKNVNANIATKAPFAVVEAYKNIRIRLLSMLEESGGKVIAFTSPNASEGKSTTAVNMAINLAQLNKKVILVDTDIRRATVHKKLKIDNFTGLSDILAREITFDNAVTKYNNFLDVLTSGSITNNPSDLIGSTDFDKLLEQLRQEYDFVIIDTPPVNVISDSLSVSQKCDGVIIITRIGVTTYADVRDAVSSLEDLNINVLGTIINGAGGAGSSYSKYGKYGSYSKYGYQ
ncbi:MAG: CpsD/CapB family tyrosine-protein kinase [Clostridia bacterium]|nr:CpsD/CapB family tyrosine-protein kinase [Clostridia bacterium]